MGLLCVFMSLILFYFFYSRPWGAVHYFLKTFLVIDAVLKFIDCSQKITRFVKDTSSQGDAPVAYYNLTLLCLVNCLLCLIVPIIFPNRSKIYVVHKIKNKISKYYNKHYKLRVEFLSISLLEFIWGDFYLRNPFH